jgi:hypothetical protein
MDRRINETLCVISYFQPARPLHLSIFLQRFVVRGTFVLATTWQQTTSTLPFGWLCSPEEKDIADQQYLFAMMPVLSQGPPSATHLKKRFLSSSSAPLASLRLLLLCIESCSCLINCHRPFKKI